MQEPTETTHTRNPFAPVHISTYKDALLADSSDSTNRLGVNTFKLIHLLCKKNKAGQDEEISVASDTTDPQNNKTSFISYRMRFQLTLQDSTQETFMNDLSERINEILQIININTPGVKLAPWHHNDIKEKDLIDSMGDSVLDAVKYLYGFKAGSSRTGTQYFRIRMVFPDTYSPDDVVSKNKGSIMIAGKQSLLKANSQSINPTVVGWFLRSNPSMVDCTDLEQVLRALWEIKGGFGLYWAAVKDGKPYDSSATARAIHIETEESLANKISSLAEKTYRQASKKEDDYPLGMNMMFVKPYGEVKGSAKALVAKLSSYQKKHEQVTECGTWFGELAIDQSIKKDNILSLRQWLMHLKSIHPKMNKDKKHYFDHLFTSIHRSDNGQEVKFYFSKVNSMEASNVIAALPLVIKEELNLDPTCFFHRSEVHPILEGVWEPETREYKNKNMIQQEQYLAEMDDLFTANTSFLGKTVEMTTNVSINDVQKQVAMANGEDDISLLSNLTDKTLQEANGVQPDNVSIQSGMTSRSKTQIAVKEALQAVSSEHNKALKEQQAKFQKEIAELKRALNQSTPKTKNTGIIELETDSQMEDDESSDTQTGLTSLQRQVQSLSTSSPAAKRTRRSSSRLKRKGGDSSDGATGEND